MNITHDYYYQALSRLEANKPLRVPKGTKINNDAVSREAGRGNGTIKKSRSNFHKLIEDIEIAARKQAENESSATGEIEKLKAARDSFREERNAALGREISLLRELYLLKKKLASLTGQNVLPIRREPNKE